ncbi:N-formylglutamate amidohydrolase [Luteimonas huabeiensis]|uniref:N-formylglutamate amidohydrolase n=1 Tax=Luteimonas huabeiensis TaxID=1244513 RepID=UPI000463FF99|nr:N-formylglutamate amidohydrolase [Luteimonas huabeiensis]
MNHATAASSRWLREAKCLAVRPCEDWDLVLGDGPVLAAAIHDGHAMRDSLRERLLIDTETRRRDEDPLTGLFAGVGDVRLRARRSRFEVDLNRPRDKALSSDPADTWGIRFWNGELPAEEIEHSQAIHDRFYAMAAELLDALLDRHGSLLVLDLHSYNHRRDGAEAAPAPADGNPEIDLGATTLDRGRWGEVVDAFADALRAQPVAGARPDVRENVRYPGGGYFPEWIHARYGNRICTLSIEYKKTFMDEWTGQADIARLYDLREGLERAVAAVRGAFGA